MRSIVFALFFPLIGCGYDFSKFDRIDTGADATVGDTAQGDASEASVGDGDAFADSVVADAGHDTALEAFNGDVSDWPDAAGSCVSSFDATKARWYVVCRPTEGTTPFNSARSYCTSHGLDLAYIDDDETNSFVVNALNGAGGLGYKAWIGLKFDAGMDADADPHWINGEPMTYTNWHSGEPYDNGVAWYDECGNVFGGDGEWRAYYCSYGSFWFICGPR